MTRARLTSSDNIACFNVETEGEKPSPSVNLHAS